jgi:hypothetical protein
MKNNKPFSMIRLDREQIMDAKDKIELLSCPNESKSCTKQLSSINVSFVESNIYRKDKDFTRSIEALKGAYHKTTELKDAACRKCVGLFKNTITQSLENIYEELEGMSTGFFKTKKYQASYMLANKVLKDFREE